MANHRSFRHSRAFGLTTPDVYTSAWVSLVPHRNLPGPAWPTTLDYVRSQQLEDGGWGDNHIYYAHDRVMSTLAALWALSEWRPNSQDEERIARGIGALNRYIEDLPQEPYETLGFELILPRLVQAVAQFGIDVPMDSLAHVVIDTMHKIQRISKYSSDDQPRSWWFNAEALPETYLASIKDTTNRFGFSPSAAAACLRALRRDGHDSHLAFEYIDKLVDGGGVCHAWPIDIFELVWTLDFRRCAQIDDPSTVPLVRKLVDQWNLRCGLGSSSAFPVNCGDETAVAYTVLHWAGLKPSDSPLMHFWQDDTFHTFPEEYKLSASVNVNALIAFRVNGQGEHKRAAIIITEWLRKQTLPLHDKWHISPFYATSRLIPVLVGWDNDFAIRCIESLLHHQQDDGGWGYKGISTVEETSYAVLGLAAAWHAELLRDSMPLCRAGQYLAHAVAPPTERLWIGKVLYQPIGVVRSAIIAAHHVLESLSLEHKSHFRLH